MLMRLIRYLMPKEERFLEHFIAHSSCIVESGKALQAFMEAPPAQRPERMTSLSAIEKQADAIARQTVISLHRAFITPFDRSDILALSNALDDAVDLIEEVAMHAELYRIETFDPSMQGLIKLIGRCAEQVTEVIPLLDDMTRNAERIRTLCEAIAQTEGEADDALREAMYQLVAEHPEPITFFARKEMYELLEAVTDRCDDVAEVIEGIMLDHV